jgi:hypothetical protein
MTIDSGIKFNTSKKWAKNIILPIWKLIYKLWQERNRVEHDEDGMLDNKKKKKQWK